MENSKKKEMPKPFQSINLKNINLKEIFTDEELDIICSEFIAIDEFSFLNRSPINISNPTTSPVNGSLNISKKKQSAISSNKINELLCDRTKFILNVLKLCCEKLKKNNFNYLAKAVEW